MSLFFPVLTTNITDSWGGALLFIAILAEMRHPWDFWKALLCAQVFIGVVYVFFGAYVSLLPLLDRAVVDNITC